MFIDCPIKIYNFFGDSENRSYKIFFAIVFSMQRILDAIMFILHFSLNVVLFIIPSPLIDFLKETNFLKDSESK